MNKVSLLAIAAGLFFTTCKKEADLDGNTVPFEETRFTLTEQVLLTIDNGILGLGGFLDCAIPVNIDHGEFAKTENPNPYAHLVEDMTIKNLNMEALDPDGCGFDFLGSIDVYMCEDGLTDFSQFVLPNSDYSNQYNAVKISSTTVPDGAGYTLSPTPISGARIEKFIHQGVFQVYSDMNIDRSFTANSMDIKTTLQLEVKLINEN